MLNDFTFVIILNKEVRNMSITPEKRIELLIFAKGFTSIHQFSTYLKEKYPTTYVTVDTIFNLIKGKPYRHSTIENIANGLDLPIECLTASSIPLLDDYLLYEVADIKNEFSSQHNANSNFSLLDHLASWDTCLELYDISKLIYPYNPMHLSTKTNFKITTLAEFCIYLPLCNPLIVIDSIYRIGGQIESLERYILNQFNYIHRHIPDSPAKHFADCEVLLLRLNNKDILSKDERQKLNSLNQYRKSKAWDIAYDCYNEDMLKMYSFYRNDIADLFYTKFPEHAHVNKSNG